VSAVWPAAIYFEREVFDLLGVTFTGHPTCAGSCARTTGRLSAAQGLPLSFAYGGVAHLREGQYFEGVPHRVGTPT